VRVTLEALLIRYGPLAIFVGTAVEGDMTAILAGVVAHLGLVGVRSAVVLAALGALASDCLYYALGRRGARAIAETSAYTRVARVVEGLAARVGPGEILLAHWVYGTRIASMLFWGARGLPVAHFVVLDLVGCAIWAGVLVSLGFWSSNSAATLLGEVRRLETWLLGALVAAAAAVLLVRAATRRRLGAIARGMGSGP
jgi:membrane protein DedA with SNARE-associated domain